MRDELGQCPPPAEDRGVAQLLIEAGLTPTERRLCEFAVEGRLLDLSTSRVDDDDPAQGQTWEAHRQIRSQLLYQLLTDRGDLDACFGPPRAIRVRGALVIASLDLSDLDLRCPLELSGCHLNSVVNLEKTKAPDVSLAGSYLSGALLARRLCLTHDLDLGGATLQAAVNLDGANIGGALACSGAQLRNDSGPALYADGLTVGDSVFLRAGFTATGAGEDGAVRLPGANISGQLACSGAQLRNDSGPALLADGLTVGGGVFLHDGFTATGTGEDGAVRLLGANVSGQLDCSAAQLRNDSGPALTADRLTVAGGVFLCDGFTATGAGKDGAVRLPGANISGQLDCPGAQLRNDSGPALLADGLTVGGDVFLREGFTATGAGERGAVRLTGANISGQLGCSGAQLRNDSGPALAADGLTVG